METMKFIKNHASGCRHQKTDVLLVSLITALKL
nr:MAG TPA: hypothetical protein [Caudoviricetes sp.]